MLHVDVFKTSVSTDSSQYKQKNNRSISSKQYIGAHPPSFWINCFLLTYEMEAYTKDGYHWQKQP
jgi:hypothetical protein